MNLSRKSKLIIKKVLSFLLIVFICLVGNIAFNLVINKTFNIKFDNIKANIVDPHNIECNQNKCTTLDDEAWLIVENKKGYILNLDLKFNNREYYDGRIYFASEFNSFNEVDTKSFTFVNGENFVNISKDAKYIRLDIANKGDIFYLNDIKLKSKFLYSITNINFVNIIIISLFIYVIYTLFKKNKIDTAFLFILLFSLYFIFKDFLFNKNVFVYTDIGADTFNQYYPYLYNLATNIKNHSFSFWNFNYGLGTSLFNNASWVFDPFAFLTVIIGVITKTRNIIYLMLWMHFTKILAVYFLSRKYFSNFFDKKIVINLCALLCSMCGYLFLWGQHYFLGTSLVFLMLLLVATEEILKNNTLESRIVFILSTAFLLVYSFYTGYMILLFLAFYILYRLLTYQKWELKSFISESLKFIFMVINGIMISSIIFIPSSYNVLTNSSRLASTGDGLVTRIVSSFTNSFDFHFLLERFSRLISNNLLFINHGSENFNNYYEMPILFITAFIIFFIVQFIVFKFKESKKSKAKKFIILLNIGIIYLIIFNNISGLIFNAFAYPVYRYTFLIVPMLIYCIGYVINKMILDKKISLTLIIISLISTLSIWLSSFYVQERSLHKISCVILLIIMLGYMLLILFRCTKKHKSLILYLFIVLVIGSNIFDNYISTNNRGILSNRQVLQLYKNVDNTSKVINYLQDKDNSYYRVEKQYYDYSLLSDSLLEFYSTNTVYNSTLNSNVQKYYDYLYPTSNVRGAIKVASIKSDNDVKILSLTNSKYILSNEEISIDGLELMERIDNIYIYKNKYTDSIAKWYNKTILKSDFEAMEENKKIDLLLDTAIVDNEVSIDQKSEATIEKFYLANAKIKGKVSTNGKGLLMLSIPKEDGWNVYVNGKKTNIININYGFIGIELKEGTYDIEAKYEVPKMRIGILISILGIVTLIVSSLIIHLYNKGE